MSILSKHNYKWFVVLSFLGIIILPGQMPSPMLRNGTLIGLGIICLLFEFLSLGNVEVENRKTHVRQMWVLIFLTILLLVVNFMV